MKKVILMTILVGLWAAGASAAMTTIEFSEVDLPNQTPLDGTSHFDAYNLSFEGKILYVIDSRILGAGDDNWGVTTTGDINDNVGNIVFIDDVSIVTADWVSIYSNNFFMDAYDSGGNLLATQSTTGLSGTSHGSYTFSGIGQIAKISFWDGTGLVGIGRLQFDTTPIPAPGAFMLGSIGVGFVGWLRRRRTL